MGHSTGLHYVLLGTQANSVTMVVRDSEAPASAPSRIITPIRLQHQPPPAVLLEEHSRPHTRGLPQPVTLSRRDSGRSRNPLWGRAGHDRPQEPAQASLSRSPPTPPVLLSGRMLGLTLCGRTSVSKVVRGFFLLRTPTLQVPQMPGSHLALCPVRPSQDKTWGQSGTDPQLWPEGVGVRGVSQTLVRILGLGAPAQGPCAQELSGGPPWSVPTPGAFSATPTSTLPRVALQMPAREKRLEAGGLPEPGAHCHLLPRRSSLLLAPSSSLS